MNKSIPYKLSTTNDKFTSRSGLILPAEILRQMDVDKLAHRYFPAPGSNRGFSPATYIRAFVLMRLEGGRCLEDIRHLQAESALLSMLGTRRSVTLDLDATAILCDKREPLSERTGLYADGGAYCRGGDDRVAAVSSWQCAALEG